MNSSERLKLFLEGKNLRQIDLSKKVKINTALINNYVTGRRRITERVALLLKEHYNINPDWLLHGTDPMYLDPPKPSYQNPTQTELNQAYESLPEEARKRVLELAKKEQEEEEERRRKLEQIKQKEKQMFDNPITGKTVSIPVLGKVVAGMPKDVYELDEGETVEIVDALIKGIPLEQLFCLRVEGRSMIDCDIGPGNIVIVWKNVCVQNNDIVIADIDGEKTIKRFRHQPSEKLIELIPCNPEHKTLQIPDHRVNILGRVIWSMKGFRR